MINNHAKKWQLVTIKIGTFLKNNDFLYFICKNTVCLAKYGFLHFYL